MASNNQRTPSAPPPPKWSNESKKNSKDQQVILNQVKEMFDTILEPDLILSVVQNCKWKLQPSIEALIMLSENADGPFSHTNQNFNQRNAQSLSHAIEKCVNNEGRVKNANEDKKEYKLNTEPDDLTNSFLNLNDKELLRQQEEFRKFELLKKDLTEKGFVYSGNENTAKSNYSQDSNKIRPPKLQQLGQNWISGQDLQTTDKNDFSGTHFGNDPESDSSDVQINPTMNLLWDTTKNTGQRKVKETNNQFENLFGSKLQFSRDLPNKISNKGTIPKSNKSQIQQSSSPQQQHQKNIDPDTVTAQNVQPRGSKNSNAQESSQFQFGHEDSRAFQYNSNAFDNDFEESDVQDSTQERQQPQQVAQFDFNYDTKNKMRTASSKSNLHKGETESLCGLKVQYRLPGLENSSDDDADVVIEEERTDYPTQIPSLMSINVCQFISCSTQSPPKNTSPKTCVTNTPSPPGTPQRDTYDNKLKHVISSIIQGHKILIILRGLPGSGKSHLATNIVKSSVSGDPNNFIFSTDDFFVMLGRGVYDFVRSKLSEAHSYTRKRVMNALKEGVSPVIVSNTNTQSWEMQPYVVMGVQHGYIIEVLEPNTPWSRNINELTKKNSHGVLKDAIKNMMDRYEPDITGQKLIEQFSLQYLPENIPPQPRKFPPLNMANEGQENHKNDKQKSSKRNRRRKKNQNANNESTYFMQNTDPLNYLLSDSDKNMKHSEKSPGSRTDNDTLDNIVSNALMSENDTLNKSLVDYCIETDSGDELDVDRVPTQEEGHVTGDKVFDLLGEVVNNESRNNLQNNSSSIDDSNGGHLLESKNDNSSNPNDFTIELGAENISNTLHPQNLGAIGSERKESVTTIDYDNQVKVEKDENNQESTENVLSQCWDFTLLVNGRQIHSAYRKPDYDTEYSIKPKPPKIEIKKEPDYTSGVIITEIEFDETIDYEESAALDDKLISENPDMINKVNKKVDFAKPQTNLEKEINLIQTDFGTELIYNESDLDHSLDLKTKSTEMREDVKTRENTMKYKHQTNDNSLSENDALQNEMSHREPSITVPDTKDSQNGLEDSSANETETSTATLVNDDLSEQLSSFLLSSNNFDKDSCQVSEPVTIDTLVTLECIVDDTLSRKLSDQAAQQTAESKNSIENSKRVNNKNSGAKNNKNDLCINPNIESSNMLMDNSDKTMYKEINEIQLESQNSESVSKNQKDEYSAKNVVKINTDDNAVQEPTISNQIDVDKSKDQTLENLCKKKNEGLEYDSLTEAINKTASEEETKSKSETCVTKCDEENFDDNQIEILNSTLDEKIQKKEGIVVSDNNITDVLSSEQESVFENHDQKLNTDDKINKVAFGIPLEMLISQKNKSPEIFKQEKESKDYLITSISLENLSDSDSSMEQCCENCDELSIPSDAESESDAKLDQNFEKEEKSVKLVPEKEYDAKKKENVSNTVEIVDNINQVTWKESPFPISINYTDPLSEISEKFEPISKSDSSTNTSNYDFNVLYVGGTSEYKILNTKSRTINSSISLVVEKNPPLKLMLDKSSMTSVVDILSGEESSLESKTEVQIMTDFAELIEMFPNIPHEDIFEIYKNLCSCDFNWTVDVLLDGVPDHVIKYTKVKSSELVPKKRTISPSSSEGGNTENENSVSKEKLNKLKQRSSSSESNESDSKLQQQSSSPRKKKDRHKVSEETLELKRQIEEKMVINEASYNPHILKVKRWRNGEPDLTTEDNVETQLQTKDVIQFSQPINKEIEEIEDFEEEIQSPETSESTDEFTEDDIEPEEMMELNLGQDFIKVLENEFGNPDFQFPDGLFPVIQVKKSMARQLHALWIESMEQQLNAQQEQLDKMIEKDAEYARSLEQEEARNLTEPEVPNLSEIMDMDLALAIYNNDLKKQLELETPNDMASRLTRQMLHDMFTNHDPEILDEILKAHNGNFKETVDVLEASTGHVVDRNNTLKKQKSLIDRAKKESIKSKEDELNVQLSVAVDTNSDLNEPTDVDAITLTYDAVMEEALESRKEAQRQLSLRNANFNKATEAFRSGNRVVAGYYSQLAKLHSKKMEHANSNAASAFLAAQDYMMSSENTLDLHYLYVAEAMQALDLFLDYQISRLNTGQKKSMNLYIITGRGARSNRGLSRIKPAVSKKLASKNIRFVEENPGCLKVVIHKRNNTVR